MSQPLPPISSPPLSHSKSVVLVNLALQPRLLFSAALGGHAGGGPGRLAAALAPPPRPLGLKGLRVLKVIGGGGGVGEVGWKALEAY